MRVNVRRARMSAAVLFAALLAIPFGASYGQNHWDAYKPGSLAAIMDAHDSTVPPNPVDGRQASW